MDLTAIVLASEQTDRSKETLSSGMLSLAGRPMLRFVVDAVRALEPTHLLVIGKDEEQAKQIVGSEGKVLAQTEQLGTGGAILQAEEEAAGRTGTILVVCSNLALLRSATLHQMVVYHWMENAAMTLLRFQPEDPISQRGTVHSPTMGKGIAEVEDTGSMSDQQASPQLHDGVFCFRDEWLWPNLAQLQPRADVGFRLIDLMPRALKQGETIAYLPLSDLQEILEADDRLRLAQAEAEMRRRINKGWMLSGVTLVDPEATYIEAGVQIGADTVIWPNTLLQGQTQIGQGCTIGPGSVIRDSTIGNGCRVELSVVEQAIMEEESEIGPFGHLRKGAHMGPGAHMGNFGEVKNSYLGPGVKMGHFSYVGDATVGENANIGAGTITCNYDGQHKHRTTIGQEAFVGSGSMLVAPVEIGDRAKTGAGSVVTHDVPADSVAYGVPARVKSGPDADKSEVE